MADVDTFNLSSLPERNLAGVFEHLGGFALELFASLPVVCRDFCTKLVLGTSIRRLCFSAMLKSVGLAAQQGDVVAAQASTYLCEEVRVKAAFVERRSLLADAALYSLRREDLESFLLCIGEGFDVNRITRKGLSPLSLCMKHNLAKSVRSLLETNVMMPPPTCSASSMVAEILLDRGGIGIMRPEQIGRTVHGMAATDVDVEGFPPLFVGMLHHSLDACIALIAHLTKVGTCVQIKNSLDEKCMAGVESESMSGSEYFVQMVQAEYVSHQHVVFQMPNFGCGIAFGHWMTRNRQAMQAMHMHTSGHLRERWKLFESEIRRPDISLPAFKLLMEHGGGPRTPEELEKLLTLVAFKERAAALLQPAPISSPESTGAGDVELVVLLLSGKLVARVILPPFASIVNVKRAVRAQSGISEARQVLLWRDKRLEDDAAELRSLYIPLSGAELQVVIEEVDDELDRQLAELHREVGWFGVTTSPVGLAQLAAVRSLLEELRDAGIDSGRS